MLFFTLWKDGVGFYRTKLWLQIMFSVRAWVTIPLTVLAYFLWKYYYCNSNHDSNSDGRYFFSYLVLKLCQICGDLDCLCPTASSFWSPQGTLNFNFASKCSSIFGQHRLWHSPVETKLCPSTFTWPSL